MLNCNMYFVGAVDCKATVGWLVCRLTFPEKFSHTPVTLFMHCIKLWRHRRQYQRYCIYNQSFNDYSKAKYRKFLFKVDKPLQSWQFSQQRKIQLFIQLEFILHYLFFLLLHSIKTLQRYALVYTLLMIAPVN